MKLFAKFTVLLLAFVCFPLHANAGDHNCVDMGTLSPDVTYTFPEYAEVIANYTPTLSGPVKFLWSGSPLTLYSASDHTEESIVGGSHSYTQNGQLMSYSNLEAGHTYYIYSAMTLMTTDLVIHEGETVLELLGVNPSVDPASPDYYGGKFSASKNYRIDLDFNYPVTVGNCLLIAGTEKARVNPLVNNATVSFDVNEAIMGLYNEGMLKEGDVMTLRMLQVKDAMDPEIKYGGSGRLEIDFVMADKPAELIDTKGYSAKSAENPLKSYYLPGDSEALMQLVFDKEIARDCAPIAQLTYGNPENLDLGLYTEEIPGVVEGNVVTFDFSGKLRRRVDMLPTDDVSQLPGSMYVAYTGIMTPDGQRAYTGMISNPTSFSASYSIQELQYTIASDFTPAKGAQLKPGSEMEIWVMNGDKIQFDEIAIDYMEKGEPKSISVGKDKIEQSVDPYSSAGSDFLYNFEVPDFSADADSEVCVYMTNLICADGLDHSADVRAIFKGVSSGVGAIGADASVVSDVFDITGRVVLRDATRAEMISLPAGVYIWCGKKIIVR